MAQQLDPKAQDVDTIPQLEKDLNEKQEREKAEMIGKLKEIGNSILKNFGLSTDNFQFQKDPTTGSYSVNFKK